MRMMLLGPPGSGKGTQAEYLIDRYRIPHVATGDMLRAAVRDGTELGKQAKATMDRGELVPDDLVIGMLMQRLANEDAEAGFILDGFPRNVAQARALDGQLEDRGLEHVVALEVPEEELTKRMLGRGRSDDTEEAVRNRLTVYREMTVPLFDYYDKAGILRRIDGFQSVDGVVASIVSALEAAG